MKFILADVKWAFERFAKKLDRYIRLPFMQIESKTPDRFERITVKKNISIPMRDGVKLYGNLYKPKAGGKFQSILIRLPYGKDESYCEMPTIGKFWARKGYTCITQDVRGKYSSEGNWFPMVNEANDGYDTIDWIAKQPWCNGNIGMMGESYYGFTTWAAATTNHPNLKCIAPSVTSMDINNNWIYLNGALCLQTRAVWAIEMSARTHQNAHRLNHWHLPLISMADEARIPSEFYSDLVKHPCCDEYWEKLNLNLKYSQIKIPALHLGGWYDLFLKATIDDWIGVKRESSNPEARENQWLFISPVDHESTPEGTHRIGRFDIGDKLGTIRWEVLQSFFDYWLKGVKNNFEKTPKVQIFVIGDNDWRYENQWPLKRTNYTKYYLHSRGKANTLSGDGILDTVKPVDEPTDSYIYDPENPVSAACETDLWNLARDLKDRKPVEKREDVLVYTTAEQGADLEITGPISLTLYAASSAVDTDFTATLVDLFPNGCPDGYAHLIQEGIIRASFRESDRKRILIEPGKVYEYTIDLWATSYVVKKGHSIRIEISSSNFDRFDRNPNTGNEFGMSAETLKATQTIYHTKKYPSHITLPVIPR